MTGVVVGITLMAAALVGASVCCVIALAQVRALEKEVEELVQEGEDKNRLVRRLHGDIRGLIEKNRDAIGRIRSLLYQVDVDDYEEDGYHNTDEEDDECDDC